MYVNCVLLKAQDSTFAYGTTSDEKGRFTFKQVATGNYLLRVSFIGYETYWKDVAVNGNVDLGGIAMTKSSTVLKEVTVSAKKPLYAVDGEKQMYNVSEDPSVQTGTVSDVLQTFSYREGILTGNLGFGMAVSLFVGIVSLLLVLGTNWISKHFLDDSIL